MLTQSLTLAEAWPLIMQAFAGRYVLSFNLEFDEGKLSESAARYGLPALPLVGACLMLRAQEYYAPPPIPNWPTCASVWARLCPHSHSRTRLIGRAGSCISCA